MFAIFSLFVYKCRGYKSGKVQAFRGSYSRLAEIRAFVHSSTPVIALTATASESVQNIIISSLGLTNMVTVEESPERKNIRYSVIDTSENGDEKNKKKHFSWLIDELRDQGSETEKIIIFSKTHSSSRDLHRIITKQLPKDKKHLVALFSSVTSDKRKKIILDDFTKEHSLIRILMATSAFGMGINVKGLHTVINYGASRTIDDYFQESGRVGRDGSQSYSIILNYAGNLGKGKTEDDMRNYLKDNETCRRQTLLNHYGQSTGNEVEKHFCCDTCAASCACGGNGECDIEKGISSCEKKLRQATKPSNNTDNRMQYRIVPDEVREVIEEELLLYQSQLANERDDGTQQYSGKEIASGFPTSLIKCIIRDIEYIGNLEQLKTYPFFNIAHADKVWTIIEELGGEVSEHCETISLVNDQEQSNDEQSTSSNQEDGSDISPDGATANLSDFDDDDDQDEIQRILSTQFCRVTLPVSESSEED